MSPTGGAQPEGKDSPPPAARASSPGKDNIGSADLRLQIFALFQAHMLIYLFRICHCSLMQTQPPCQAGEDASRNKILLVIYGKPAAPKLSNIRKWKVAVLPSTPMACRVIKDNFNLRPGAQQLPKD